MYFTIARLFSLPSCYLNIALPTLPLPTENVITLEQKINCRSYPMPLISSFLSPSFSLSSSLFLSLFMSSNLRTVALVSQTFAGCASPKRVEEQSSGRRGKEEGGDRDTGKCNIEFPQGPRGHRSPSWQIYVAGIREVRAVYINLITWNDVTSERPRPLLRRAPRTHQYCKALASAPSSMCHSCRSRALRDAVSS